MKILGNALRPSMIILHNNQLYKVVKTQHVKPGKGGAYAQVELKNVINSTKLNERFRSDENLERITLEQLECNFLYEDNGMYIFMNLENYEQINIDKNIIQEDQMPYITEGINIIVETYEEKPINIILPTSFTATVVETEPVIKGQTATGSFKPAILDNGVRIMVPQHVNIEDKIVINPQEQTYIEKAK